MAFVGRGRGQSVAGRRGRVDEFLDLRGAAAFQHAHGALNVDIHILDRLFNRGDDVANAGKMEDEVSAGKNRRVRLKRTDVEPMEFDIAAIVEMREVAFAPACEIIDYSDRVAARQQGINHVTADEA